MLERENVKLSWSMPQINEINVNMTEGTDPKPYTGNDGMGQGAGQAGSKYPPVS